MYTDATMIIHNMLVDLNDNVQEEWDCDDGASDIDDASRIPEKDVLYTPLPYGAPLGWRREQLQEFVCETQVFPHKFNFAPGEVENDDFSCKNNSLIFFIFNYHKFLKYCCICYINQTKLPLHYHYKNNHYQDLLYVNMMSLTP